MRVMLRFVLVLVVLLAALAGFFLGTRTGQDILLTRAVDIAMGQMPAAEYDGLRVFMCGTSSPLIAPGRAQACVAIRAGRELHVVDAGTGSAAVMALAGEPVQNLRAILLTHFHSDHIAGIGDFNLASWATGRDAPLRVLGPPGVERVVAGFNEAFAQDREYRVAHHGADLLDPEVGLLDAVAVENGVIVDRGGLRVTAFPVDHSPVQPAVGYRFEYAGRSVVVSGDTVVTESLVEAARGADLLLQDALSMPIVTAMQAGAERAGRRRQARILLDIQDYHAAGTDLQALVDAAGVGMLAVYHLVPAPRNLVMERIFERSLPEDTVMTAEGMVFELPRGTDRIRVMSP